MLRCRNFFILVSCLTVGIVGIRSTRAQEVDPDEAKEKSVIDRFVAVLEKNPRRGTALDKVYGFHVERGSLEGLVKGYRDKATHAKGTDAGAAWMMVGLFESLRGHDALAAAAFEQAENLVSGNYLASYYLGQSLVLVGQPDKAAEALERSISRKPAQADLLEIYQGLGRIYQRAQKNDKALEVWNRLEKQFPNDARVQEQIATTLLEENEFAAALPRFENLAKTTKDKYRQSLFQMEVAEIKVRLGKSDEAIKDYEKLLGQLLPENWLYREVRRRIEAVYLRTDDQAGLIAYYETWIKRNENDLEAISRLSRLLSGFGRSADARQWLEKGLKVAPKNKELRHALISMLVFEHKTSEAIVQYEQLDKYEPNNSDTLREWGRLILKDKSLEEGSRKTAAAAVWRRLSDARPKDPLIVSQVGELFRQSEMTEEALELYKKAVSLAPEQSQYREYLGEYFHTLNRKDDALSTWRAIADGALRTAPNLARLAEVLANFGYLAEAVETNAEACQLDPKDFLLQMKRVDLLAQAEKHDKALEQLAVVRKLAANEEEREACLVRELRELQSIGKLTDHIADLKKELDDPQSSASKDADQWFQLARAHEAARQLNDASRAIAKALTLTPQSIPILTASARIHEAQNNLLAASDINRKLAQIDRRYRTEYLKQVAALEQKLGRRDKALQAGRDLVAAAPGNTEMSEFFSQLCFQLGENEEGLNALRRSVRINPTDSKGMLLLASALAEQFRTSESIELYWRAFEKAANLDDRLSITPKLADLYLQTNQFDRMIERLERQRREPNQNREMTICLAQAYQSVGDDGSARQELEKLLTEETRDIPLLSQLVKLCEAGGDLEAAVKFQQQLLKIAPGREETMRLAQLLMKSGETEEAKALMSSHTVVDEKDPNAVLKSIDSLLNQGNNDQALAMIQKLTAEQPQNWELLYREGVALAKSKDKSAEARSRFEAILALNLSDDEESLLAKAPAKKGQATPQPLIRAPKTLTQRTQTATQIRQATGLVGSPGTIITTSGTVASTRTVRTAQPMSWTPQDFGDARMACLGWLNVLARNEGKEKEEAFLNERRAMGEKSENIRELMDCLYLAQLANSRNDIYLVLKKLSQRPEAEVWIKAMYLTYLTWRAGPPVRVISNVAPGPDDDADPMPNLVPLENEELEHVLACLKAVDDAGTQMSSTSTYLQLVTTELKRSGRKDQAATMLTEAIESSVEPSRIASLLPGFVQRNDFKNALKVIDRLAELKPVATGLGLRNANGTINYSQFAIQPANQSQIVCQLMDKRAQKNELGDSLLLWDRYVPIIVARLEQQLSLSASTKKQIQSSQNQMSPTGTGSVIVWRNGAGRGEALDFPAENEIYDRPAIQLLHQMFQLYKEAKKTSDLISHFQSKLADENTPVAQKPLWHFGLGYLNWWLGEKDEAVRILAEATMPDNQEMKFELARLYEKTGEHGRALEIIDSLAPTDQRAMQNREITALRMAVNSGNVDRARTAAERLFGLRLDSNVQIQLAQQMRQLGMHEQAEAVLARAGRQAGNKTDVLLTLMQEYQTQGKNDVATQIAHQLLRRSGNNSGSALFSGRVATGTTTRTISVNGRVMTVNNPNDTRQQALSVLKKSGKLPEMIKKVEAQLQNAPNSQRLIETLIEYATANGDNKKVEELTAKIAESKKNDPQFQFKLGQQLAQQRKHSEAIVYFKAAIAKDPTLLQTGYSQLYQTFQNTDQLNEIVTLVEGLDTTVAENLRPITYFLQEMSRGVLTRDSTSDHRKNATIRLLKKAWAAYPDQRQQFIGYIQGNWFWQMPEMYDYAREAILPASPALTSSNPWHGFGQNLVRHADGNVHTQVTRLLTIASSQKKLDALANDVATAQRAVMNWDGGIALLALIDLRRGNPERAIPALEALLPKAKASSANSMNYVILWEIGQELMEHTSSIDLAIRYLESAMETPDSISFSGFHWSPMKPLIRLYQKVGRLDDAERLVLSVGSRIQKTGNSSNESREAYQRIQSCLGLTTEIKEMGFPLAAIRITHEQLARSEDFVKAANLFAGSAGTQTVDRLKNQIEASFQTALTELKPAMLPQLLAGPAYRMPEDQPASAMTPNNAPREPIDLLLLVQTRDLETTQLSSAFGALVSRVAKSPELFARTKDALGDVQASQPDDLGVQILAIQISLIENQFDQSSAKINRLLESIERVPLDAPPTKGGFSISQRTAAKPQMGLWLVARECLKQKSLQGQGTKLAERALEAARRQTDNGYQMAILREWGQLAVEAGDKETAERHWNEMLETVIPGPPKQATR